MRIKERRNIWLQSEREREKKEEFFDRENIVTSKRCIGVKE